LTTRPTTRRFAAAPQSQRCRRIRKRSESRKIEFFECIHAHNDMVVDVGWSITPRGAPRLRLPAFFNLLHQLNCGRVKDVGAVHLRHTLNTISCQINTLQTDVRAVKGGRMLPPHHPHHSAGLRLARPVRLRNLYVYRVVAYCRCQLRRPVFGPCKFRRRDVRARMWRHQVWRRPRLRGSPRPVETEMPGHGRENRENGRLHAAAAEAAASRDAQDDGDYTWRKTARSRVHTGVGRHIWRQNAFVCNPWQYCLVVCGPLHRPCSAVRVHRVSTDNRQREKTLFGKNARIIGIR
jgi:hypothetical protein